MYFTTTVQTNIPILLQFTNNNNVSMAVIIWYVDFHLPMHSVLNTLKVVGLTPMRCT